MERTLGATEFERRKERNTLDYRVYFKSVATLIPTEQFRVLSLHNRLSIRTERDDLKLQLTDMHANMILICTLSNVIVNLAVDES